MKILLTALCVFVSCISLQAMERTEILKKSAIDQNENDSLLLIYARKYEAPKRRLEKVLMQGANIDVQDEDGMTALHFVAQRGDEASVRFLIEQGAHKRLGNGQGQTAYDLAPDQLKHLFALEPITDELTHKNNKRKAEDLESTIRKRPRTVIDHLDSNKGSVKVAQTIEWINYDFENEAGKTMLPGENRPKAAMQLTNTQKKTVVNTGRNERSILIGAAFIDPNVSQAYTEPSLVLNQGSKSDESSENIKDASINVHDGLIKVKIVVTPYMRPMIQNGAVSSNGITSAHPAFVLPTVGSILSFNDNTAPHLGFRGSVMSPDLTLIPVPNSFVSFLANARDENGRTVLHVACVHYSIELLTQLLAYGADLNVEDKGGLTPLHYAALYGKLHSAALLIQKGAFLNACDKRGRTPLMLAATGSHAMVNFLLLMHANFEIKDPFGQTYKKYLPALIQ